MANPYYIPTQSLGSRGLKWLDFVTRLSGMKRREELSERELQQRNRMQARLEREGAIEYGTEGQPGLRQREVGLRRRRVEVGEAGQRLAEQKAEEERKRNELNQRIRDEWWAKVNEPFSEKELMIKSLSWTVNKKNYMQEMYNFIAQGIEQGKYKSKIDAYSDLKGLEGAFKANARAEIEKDLQNAMDPKNPKPALAQRLTNMLDRLGQFNIDRNYGITPQSSPILFGKRMPQERDPTSAEPRAIKSWVTPNGEILNLPNNQAPPEGSVPYSTGMELEVGAEGGVSLRTGVRGGKQGVTLSTQTKLQQGILDTSAGIQRLEQVAQSYRPEFLRLATKWKSFTTKWKEKLQGTGIERWANLGVPQQDRKLLADYSAFKRDAIDNINRYIKGDAPTEFISKWKSSMKALKLSQARFMYLTQNGMTPQSIKAMAGNDTLPSLDKIKTIIERRDMEIEREIKQTNPNISKDVLDKAVSQRLKEEFGL
jgi:hypothetical protein